MNNNKIKLALGIEYNGKSYYGWQRQKKIPSIQECLEKAISKVANEPIIIYCAGRTDTGVHAIGQVIHFTTTKMKYLDKAWTLGVNANLPNDIAVSWVKKVTSDFHARFSATARHYKYIIYNHHIRPILSEKRLTHFYRSLNIASMMRASRCLVGKKDFTSFSSLDSQSNNYWRKINYLNIIQKEKYIIIDIKANSFVRHMVRNIIGSLLEVGVGYHSEKWIAELLTYRNRNQARGAIAPADGLYLVSIDYPKKFCLPILTSRSLFFI